MVKKPTYEELEQRFKELEESAFKYKQVEEVLHETEEQYRDLVENVNIGIYRNTGGPHGVDFQIILT
jgi:PAS domain-containing protein